MQIMALVAGLFCGSLLATGLYRRRRARQTVTVPAGAVVLDVLTRLVAQLREGNGMRAQIQIGGERISLEAWKKVTRKLVEQLAPYLGAQDVSAIESFLEKATRAWPDLERQAQRAGAVEGPPIE